MNDDEHAGFIDGNGLAGRLRDVFAAEMTTARGRCANCGRVAVLAETRVFVDAPGDVVRCRSCDAVLLRMVRGPDRAWIDMRGLAVLEIALPSQ